VEPSRSMLFEGLTRLEHLVYLINTHCNVYGIDDDTLNYLVECDEFIGTIKEIWY